MRARAEATEETRRRIVDAAIALYYERPGPDSTLEEIAQRASVTVQTILRHFGSRAALVEAAQAEARLRILEERRSTPGDVEGSVRALFDHYERLGRSVLGLLAQETLTGAPDLSDGRAQHRGWVAGVFAPQLSRLPPRRREALADELVVATDVYAWKLLRLDRVLERRAAEERVAGMITALLRCTEED